jgi:2-polyprenyl-6-methoxyphenol hydroxylase-like FAD-dependent oxidoreductase
MFASSSSSSSSSSPRPLSTGLAQWEVSVSDPALQQHAPHVYEFWASGRRLLAWPTSPTTWTLVGFCKAKIAAGTAFQQSSTRSFKHFADEFTPFFDSPLLRDLFAVVRRYPDERCALSNTLRAPVPYGAVHSSLPIILVGEAVHGASLSGHWGTNLDLEDGWSVAQHLAASIASGSIGGGGSIVDVLRAWETQRKERWTVAVREKRRHDLLTLKVGRTREWLRSVAMRWGGNRLLAKELRIAQGDDLVGGGEQ